MLYRWGAFNISDRAVQAAAGPAPAILSGTQQLHRRNGLILACDRITASIHMRNLGVEKCQRFHASWASKEARSGMTVL
jgi:hypothetical protein